MKLALILISSVLLVIHVQSIPDGCQRSIHSLIVTLNDAAGKLGMTGHNALHAHVSEIATSIMKYWKQKRANATGDRYTCIIAIEELLAELKVIRKHLRPMRSNNEDLMNASDSIDKAIETVATMLDYRQTN